LSRLTRGLLGFALLLAFALVSCVPDVAISKPPVFTWLWQRTFGGVGNDYANAVAVDAVGAAYVVGSSDDGFGWTNAGGKDAFVQKLSANGQQAWTRAVATAGNDLLSDVVANAGQILAVGSSDGPNGLGSNLSDATLHSWDANGLAGSGLRFGSAKADAAVAIAVAPDSVAPNSVFIAGWTDAAIVGSDPNPKARDAFVARLKLEAPNVWRIVWSQQLACSSDCEANGVALDAQGNVYLTGYSDGDIGSAKVVQGPDAFVAKFSSDGVPQWARLIGGSGSETANAIAAGSSGIYLVGYADAGLGDQRALGLDDAFVVRLDVDGQVLWQRLLGTAQADAAVDVSVDLNGVQLVGYSDGNLETNSGQPVTGGKADAFLAQFDANGTGTSLLRLGGPGSDYANGLASGSGAANLEPNGVLTIAGYTDASLPGNSSAGFFDAFVARYGPTP
jgi:hypothetical protein